MAGLVPAIRVFLNRYCAGIPVLRSCPPTGPRKARPDDRLRRASCSLAKALGPLLRGDERESRRPLILRGSPLTRLAPQDDGSCFVGWVERSETHRSGATTKMGFAMAQPILRAQGYPSPRYLKIDECSLLMQSLMEIRTLRLRHYGGYRYCNGC